MTIPLPEAVQKKLDELKAKSDRLWLSRSESIDQAAQIVAEYYMEKLEWPTARNP